MNLSLHAHEAVEVTPERMRLALGQFATGVTIVTCLGRDGQPVGLTANSFGGVSLNPPLVLWSLRVNSPSLPAFRKATRFAVNMLAADQHDLSNHFAASVADKFTVGDWEQGLDGVPVLARAPAVLECAPEQEHLVGDHVLFVGRVLRLSGQGGSPLLFHGGAYHSLGRSL